MKRIATELGAGTMTLYDYVRTKADLVALMQDAILSDPPIPDDELPSDWREAVTVIARRTRATVLLAHPWSIASLDDAQFGPLTPCATSSNPWPSWTASSSPPAGEAVALGDRGRLRVRPAPCTPSRRAPVSLKPSTTPNSSPTPSPSANSSSPPESFRASQRSTNGKYGSDPTTSHDRGSTSIPTTADRLADQFEHGLTALLDGLTREATPDDTPRPTHDQPLSTSD